MDKCQLTPIDQLGFMGAPQIRRLLQGFLKEAWNFSMSWQKAFSFSTIHCGFLVSTQPRDCYLRASAPSSRGLFALKLLRIRLVMTVFISSVSCNFRPQPGSLGRERGRITLQGKAGECCQARELHHPHFGTIIQARPKMRREIQNLIPRSPAPKEKQLDLLPAH